MHINPPTVRNWCDEFDPHFGHRTGWYEIYPRSIGLSPELKLLTSYRND